ncbi:MAG: hypothetical protein F6K10_40940 [Moorea sp. SIO2B7]|nr:hypothetical protein [Moorena sp. SIO2B7]
MKPFSENTFSKTLVQSDDSPEVIATSEQQSRNLLRKAELWSGRFAMLGFVTTVMAIAFKSTM